MNNNNNSGFYTFKGYQLKEESKLTSSMEDYLEMICRLYRNQEFVRINELSARLHVRPSSASKMVNNLKFLGYVTFERYGYIKPTVKGLAVGEYLLYRHDVLNEFLCLINQTENETEQVEKIEHFLDKTTVDNIRNCIETLKRNA